MKFKNPIRSLISVNLLLLFMLQAGLGLYLHNSFHKHTPLTQTQPVQKAGLAITPATSADSCTCEDDFLLHFTMGNQPVLPHVPLLFFVQHNASYYNYLPHSLRIFRPLRAPPAVVS